MFCGRLPPGDGGDDGAASEALRRALLLACEFEEIPTASGVEVAKGEEGDPVLGSSSSSVFGGRLAAGSLAVSELVPLQMVLNDKRFYGYFAGRTQV